MQRVLNAFFGATILSSAACPDYNTYSEEYHAPFSSGRYNLSYQRPPAECRTFKSPVVEDTIVKMENVIKDPDLYRLFLNAYPSTLDTAVKWKGFANGTDEELTFLITGDINAMWLRDSANQLQSYFSLLRADSSYDSIASLYRGLINLQARYLGIFPYCNAFQAPVEAGLDLEVNIYGLRDVITPSFSNQSVFECKYELDSLASFLQISTEYYEATGDAAFFGKYSWTNAVHSILNVAGSELLGTYAENGTVNLSPYTMARITNSATETLSNHGAGNPVAPGTGLVRSAYRPSDDACTYQLFIPANMQFARYLQSASAIAYALGSEDELGKKMSSFADSIRAAITQHGIVHDARYGDIYAYEVDGFGSRNLMDDANIPSLLAAPAMGYLDINDTVYQATRRFILSKDNPYFMRGPVINGVGGPHEGPGMAWPMASIVQIITSDDDAEITQALKEIVSSTAGLGLIHESINTFHASEYTRQWFSWANGLFGQMILDLYRRKPDLLALSYQ